MMRVVSLLMLFSAIAVTAQPGAPGQMSGMDLTLMKLFSGHKAFTARSEIEVTGAVGPGDMTMPAEVAMLDGKMRTDIDMSRIKGKAMPAEALAQMKQMGMDRAINILSPGQNKMLVVFPNMKAYVSMPVPEQAASSLTNQADIQATELGKETVAGHPCVKKKVMVGAGNGKGHELTVWNATDLQDFPVQIELVENGSKVVCKYSNIKFSKPDAMLFEPPAGYKGYTDMQDMMMTVMSKMMEENMRKTPQTTTP